VKLYWYWPFSREEYLPLPMRVGEQPEVDELLVSTIDRPGTWTGGAGRTRIVADLPAVRRPARGAPWALDRASVFARRAALRDRAVRRADPDVLHLWYSSPWIDPVDVRRLRRRRPTVLHVHDVWPHEARLPDRAVAAQLRALYTAPSALVVYHRRLRDALVADFDIDPSLVSVIPHPVPTPHAGADLAADPAATTALFFGTFRPNKGLHVLVEAIRRLGPQAGVRWVLAGRGDADLERLVAGLAAERSDVEARIGWSTAEEKSCLYARADLVVLPYTTFASQSGVLHDAYGHGRAVLVTDVGALGPTVRADGTGWVVAPGDPAALAEGLAGAIADGPDRARRASAAAGRAEEGAPERVAARLVSLYAAVLGGSALPGGDGAPTGAE
jgi:glycosyltransferase involved in cell wall biosynthesis